MQCRARVHGTAEFGVNGEEVGCHGDLLGLAAAAVASGDGGGDIAKDAANALFDAVS